MYKEKNGKMLTAKLVWVDKKLYLQPIKYNYGGGNAGFTYKLKETRFCRNQQILFPFIDVLKRAEIWPFVTNKDFLEEQRDTKKFTKSQLKEKLRKAM